MIYSRCIQHHYGSFIMTVLLLPLLGLLGIMGHESAINTAAAAAIPSRHSSFPAKHSADSPPYSIQIIEFSPEVIKKTPTMDNTLRNQLDNINRIFEEIVHGRHAPADSPVDLVLLPEYGLNAPIMRTKQEAKMFSQILDQRQLESSRNCSRWTFTGENDAFILSQLHSMESGQEDTSHRWTLVLEKLSCLAQHFGIYSCFNMIEQHPTRDELFNTMFCLDRHGDLVAKYRKRHLYGNEPQMFQIGYGDNPVFESDFGVRFGLMICFDLMFVPRDVNIHAWLMSSWWVNFPPQINALQMQMSYAATFGVKLYVSNAGNSWHTSGSGAYTSQGEPLGVWYNPTFAPITESIFVSDHSLVANLDHDKSDASLEKRNQESAVDVPTMEELVPSSQSTEMQTKESMAALEIQQPNRKNNPRLMDFKVKVLPAAGKITLEHWEDQVTVGSISCNMSVDTALPEADSVQKYRVYAMYAISGPIWAVRGGDICGLIYCGSLDHDPASMANETHQMCQDTLTFKKMHQDAPSTFNGANIHVHFKEEVYGAFPLIAQTNMSLPSTESIHFNTIRPHEEYSLQWKGDEDKHLAAFQVLGLREPARGIDGCLEAEKKYEK